MRTRPYDGDDLAPRIPSVPRCRALVYDGTAHQCKREAQEPTAAPIWCKIHFLKL